MVASESRQLWAPLARERGGGERVMAASTRSAAASDSEASDSEASDEERLRRRRTARRGTRRGPCSGAERRAGKAPAAARRGAGGRRGVARARWRAQGAGAEEAMRRQTRPRARRRARGLGPKLAADSTIATALRGTRRLLGCLPPKFSPSLAAVAINSLLASLEPTAGLSCSTEHLQSPKGNPYDSSNAIRKTPASSSLKLNTHDVENFMQKLHRNGSGTKSLRTPLRNTDLHSSLHKNASPSIQLSKHKSNIDLIQGFKTKSEIAKLRDPLSDLDENLGEYAFVKKAVKFVRENGERDIISLDNENDCAAEFFSPSDADVSRYIFRKVLHMSYERKSEADDDADISTQQTPIMMQTLDDSQPTPERVTPNLSQHRITPNLRSLSLKHTPAAAKEKKMTYNSLVREILLRQDLLVLEKMFRLQVILLLELKFLNRLHQDSNYATEHHLLEENFHIMVPDELFSLQIFQILLLERTIFLLENLK